MWTVHFGKSKSWQSYSTYLCQIESERKGNVWVPNVKRKHSCVTWGGVCGVVERKSISNKRQEQTRSYIYGSVHIEDQHCQSDKHTNSRPRRRSFSDKLPADWTSTCIPIVVTKTRTWYSSAKLTLQRRNKIPPHNAAWREFYWGFCSLNVHFVNICVEKPTNTPMINSVY
jgi:hypothetical protein